MERFDAPPPIAAPLYRLTPHGLNLLPTLFALVRWAQPLMTSGPDSTDIERGRWTAFAVRAFITEVPSDVGDLTVRFDHPTEPVTMTISRGAVTATIGSGPSSESATADVRVTGPVWYQLGLLCGEISFADAHALLDIIGRRDPVTRFRRLLVTNHSHSSRSGAAG